MKALIGLLAVGLSIGAASAQETELGSRLAKPRVAALARNGPGAIRAAHDFAGCLVNRRESLARQYLTATTTDAVDGAGLMLFRKVDCLNMPGLPDFADARRLNMSTDIQRGVLAEALVERMGKTIPAPLPLEKAYSSPYTAVSGRNQVVEEMAVCMAATNPAAIHALTRTTAETAEEAAAMQVLIPQLGPCLQTNTRLSANRPSLRAALAEALFHRMDAASGTPAQ